MPSGKKGKKKEGGGKKKKKNGNRNVAVAINTDAFSSMPSSSSSSNIKGIIPDFSDLSVVDPNTCHTLYSRYKAATERFLNYMRSYCPDEDKIDKGVNFLFSAVNFMAETNHILDHGVLSDLKLSIRLRSRVASSVFGGGDAGHKYFLQVLIYCWPMLNSLPKKKNESKGAAALDEQYDENSFAILTIDDGDDVEHDEGMFPTSPVQLPEPLDKPLTIKEMLSSEDRSDAIIFLMTLDDLMKAVANQYDTLVKNIHFHQREGISSTAMLENLMETAVTANMAIQQVQQLEMEIQAHHEHLTTPYRLLSTLAFPETALKVMSIMRKHAVKKWNERDVTSFLGDCIECHFRAQSDKCNKKDSVVHDFCTLYNVDATGQLEIENIFLVLRTMVTMEVPIKPEKESESFIHMQQTLARSGATETSHTWIRNMDFIGGDRAIHHTIRLLQSFGPAISGLPLDKKLGTPRGLFGKSPWQAGMSKTIHGDLDELFMCDIIVNWISMYREGILGRVRLPYENEICPLFVKIREYVENPDKSVTWSLAFGVHAMLTGVLTVDRDLDNIMTTSKITFDHYIRQVTWAIEHAKNEEEMQKNKAWLHNSSFLLFLENLGLEGFGERMLWNPLCAGTTFSILNYVGNLYFGCTLIDCQAQLRISLYLYHGLLINGIIKEGDAPLLDVLFDAFKESKAIWAGSLPQRGELVKRFWICYGMSFNESKRMAEKAKLDVNETPFTLTSFDDCDVSFARGRKMHPIDPADIATSFRRICYRDFKGIEDKYHTAEQRERTRDSELYGFCVRSNETLDAMEEEQPFSAVNFAPCAYYLEQFVCSLGRVMLWEPHLKLYQLQVEGRDKRQGLTILFAQQLLGTLDFTNGTLNHEFLIVSSTFMKEFFQAIPPIKILWYQHQVGKANPILMTIDE